MDMKLFPAILTPLRPGGYAVRFYDIPRCRAAGGTTEEATENARDSLGRALFALEKTGTAIPSPTPISKIPHRKDTFFIMITVDMDEYRDNAGNPFSQNHMPLWPKPGKTSRAFYKKQ